MEDVSPEERQVRLKKADSIRKMLAEQSTTSNSNTTGNNFFYSVIIYLTCYLVFNLKSKSISHVLEDAIINIV